MDSNYGIIVKENETVKFDSRKSHLILPGPKSPSYIILTTINTSAQSAPANVPVSNAVLTINHGLGYAPFIDCYFYDPAGQPPNNDILYQDQYPYYKNYYPILPAGSFLETESLSVKVDDIKVTITDNYFNYYGGTSTADSIKAKIMIFANEGQLQP